MDYQGLTIQFNGDASGLLATLKQIDGATTSTQRSLSQVTAALKLDPSSAALYQAQGRLIRTDYKDRGDALFRLQNSYDDYTKKLRDARAEEARVTSQLADAKNRYESVSRTLKESTESYDVARSRWAQLHTERSQLMRREAQYLSRQNELEARQAELLTRNTSNNEVYVRSLKKRANLTTEQKNARQAAINGKLLNNTNAAIAKNSKLLDENGNKLHSVNEEYARVGETMNSSVATMRRTGNEQKRYGAEVKDLTKQQKELNAQTKAYSKEAKELQRKIAITEAEMKRLGEEMAKLDVSEWLNTTKSGKFFQGLKQGGAAISGLGDKLMTLGTRITATEIALGGLFARSVISEAEEYGNAISMVGGYLELSGQQLDEMSDLALYWGKETQFSATEAADAMSELAKGGMTDAQIKGGALEATMQLAAAGGISMADAATVAVNAIKVFDLSAEDATDVADALAGAANKSTAEIGTLAQAFRYVSGWAGLADYSINDVSGALGLLADHGLQAEMAGTGLRNFMQRLGAPTDKARAYLEQYGVEVYDASGKMKRLTSLVDELNDAFKDLDDAERNEVLNNIFGARALPAAIALMEAGSDELSEYILATEKEGYALDMMQARMGDLGWALEYLRGEFETAQVNLGGALTPMLIDAAEAAENLLSAFNSLSREEQFEWATRLLKIAAIGPSLLAVGAAMKVIGGAMVGISRVAVAIKTLGTAGSTFNMFMNALSGGALAFGGGVAALVGGLAALAAVLGGIEFAKYQYGQYKAQQRTEKLERATNGLRDAIWDTVNPAHKLSESLDGMSDSARGTTQDVYDLIDAQADLADEIAERDKDADYSETRLERAREAIEKYGGASELTARQHADLAAAVEYLNSVLGTNYSVDDRSGLIYDEQGAVVALKDSIYDLIEAEKARIRLAAISADLEDMYRQQYEYEQQIIDQKTRVAEAQERLNEIKRKWNSNDPEYQGRQGHRQYYNDRDDAVAQLEEEKQALDDLYSAYNSVNDSIAAAEQYYADLRESQEEARNVVKEYANENGEFSDSLNNALEESGISMEDFAGISEDEFGRMLDECGGDVDALTQKVLELRQAMVDEQGSVDDKLANEAAEAVRKANEEYDDFFKVPEDRVDSFYNHTKAAFDKISRDYDDIWSNDASIDTTKKYGPEFSVSADTDPIYQFMQALSEIPPKTNVEVDAGGNFLEWFASLLEWNKTTMYNKQASADVSGNLGQKLSELSEWNSKGMQSKWGQATIAVAVQMANGKAAGFGLASGGMLYRHADGYITNHSLYSGNHVIGEAGIEAVLPLNNRAATQPLVDAIADGVSSRIGGGNQYNLYINDARVNDDPAIRSAFIDLMGAVNRKGMQTNAAR